MLLLLCSIDLIVRFSHLRLVCYLKFNAMKCVERSPKVCCRAVLGKIVFVTFRRLARLVRRFRRRVSFLFFLIIKRSRPWLIYTCISRVQRRVGWENVEIANNLCRYTRASTHPHSRTHITVAPESKG